MKKKHWTTLGLALGVLVLGILVGLMTVGTVAADPTPGKKIQIPRLDVGDVSGNGDWETWIQVQNVSLPDPVTGVEPATGAIFMGWGDYSEVCPTNDPGVIAHYCQLIQGNALWTLKSQITETVKSAIVYTVREDVFMEACYASEETERDTTAWRCWLEEWEFGTCEEKGGGWADPPGAKGEEVAVTVTRYGPNDYGTFVSSTYTGISEEMDGEGAPWEYYAPYIMKGYYGLDTELTIQNSGELCTSVWIDYMPEGTCRIQYKQHIEQLAPGESVRVPSDIGDPLECFWLGSAHISAEQPLGIIVDQTSFVAPCFSDDPGTLLTHRARPEVELRDGVEMLDTKVYADLIFREWSGWSSSIQVQNLSRTGLNTFVTVDFLDNSGDEILFLADWVCPGDSTTFYLPIVTNLGFDYVGAAEIESHDQVNYPGGTTGKQPIFAVVDLKKEVDPPLNNYAQGGSYNAHPYSQKEWVSQIALPFISKSAAGYPVPPAEAWTSLIAIRNNSNCNKIRPEIHFKDETGTIVCKIQSFWLRPKHVKMFDLSDIGCLWPGYVGAAKVYVDEYEQLCDLDGDGVVDRAPLMPSVIVVQEGILGLPYGGGGEGVTALADTNGDITSIYEGIPYAKNIPTCYGDVKGEVWSEKGYDSSDPTSNPFPLFEATVEVVGHDPAKTDATDSTGWYQITDVISGTQQIKAYATGFMTCTKPVDIPCNDQVYWNPELRCADIDFSVFVTQENGSYPVYDADVHVDFSLSDHACVDDNDLDGATAVTGWYTFTDALQLQDTEAVTVTVSKTGYDTKVVTPPATDFYTCPGTATDTITLCAHFTVYGIVTDTIPYVGYTVQAEREDTGAVMGTPSVSGINGNYAVGDISVATCQAAGGFFLRTYAPGDVIVDAEGPFTCTNATSDYYCGAIFKNDIDFP